MSLGHASMQVGPEYMSWWPGEPRDYTISGKVPLYSAPHVFKQSFADDKYLEGQDDKNSPNVEKPPKDPDHTIPLQHLDEQRILHWWATFSQPGHSWTTLGQNCSTTVGRALMVGGGDDYAEGISGWWKSWNTVWTPKNVLSYANSISKGLHSLGSRHFAINFVRRFTHSALGFTSTTTSMDETGLATALYNEHGSEPTRVEQVLNEVYHHRRLHAAAVFEAYVNLLMQRKGAPLEAVKRTPAIKKRLIDVLNFGWVTANQQKCITFLKQLS